MVFKENIEISNFAILSLTSIAYLYQFLISRMGLDIKLRSQYYQFYDYSLDFARYTSIQSSLITILGFSLGANGVDPAF